MEWNSAKYVDDLIDEDEIPELTAEDFAQARPYSELPPEEQISWGPVVTIHPDGMEPYQYVRRTVTGSGTDRESVSLPPEVLAPFRARGAGWEQLVEGALREWLRDHAA